MINDKNENNIISQQAKYAEKIFSLLDESLENNGKYSYNIAFLKNTNSNLYTVVFGIDDDYKNTRRIEFFTYEELEIRKPHTGNFYNCFVIGKDEKSFTEKEAFVDFFESCDFNFSKISKPIVEEEL